MAANPNDVAAKWASRLSASTTEIQNGVNQVQTAPGQAAAAQADLWLAKVMASKDKWKNNVGKVSLADWKNKMLTVGVPRIASGATANQPKMAAFMSQFLPYLEAGRATIDAMPKMSIEDSIAKAAAQIRYNAKFVRN